MKIIIAQYKDITKYLNDFSRQTLKEKPQLSLRGISRLLGWPLSYLSDVINERKAFTISRAVEFAAYFSLSDFEMEHLFTLTLAKSNNDSVKRYAHMDIPMVYFQAMLI